MSRNVLLLTNHGNEPYLLGISVALKSGADCICVPHYYHSHYGEPDQLEIIKEEFPTDSQKIFLSESLGLVLKPILRSAHDSRTYPQYVKDIYKEKSGKLGIERTFNKLKRLIEKGVKAKNIIDSTESKIFHFEDFNFAINLGLPIESPIKPTHYVFTTLMSEVYKNSTSKVTFEETNGLEPLAEYWEKLEDNFDIIFVPKINALSHLSLVFQNVIYTPPLAKIIHLNESQLKEDSILLIPSATGKDREKFIQLIPEIKKIYKLVSYSKKIQHVKKVSTSVFADHKLLAVISRGGWGSNWKCLIHSKPIGFFYTEYLDDPEIAHTIMTLKSLDIGFSIEQAISNGNFPSKERLFEIKDNISKLMNENKSEFVVDDSTYINNGIDFVANHISSNIGMRN